MTEKQAERLVKVITEGIAAIVTLLTIGLGFFIADTLDAEGMGTVIIALILAILWFVQIFSLDSKSKEKPTIKLPSESDE